MKITFLGTCAGSVPLSDRHHASFVVQAAGHTYWFDAGEGCSRTAYLAKVDLLSTAAIFITHMAMDHVGGLAPLLWALRKLNKQTPPHPLSGTDLQIMIPHVAAWYAIIELVEATSQFNFASDFLLRIVQYHDGVAYDDGSVRVLACHNSHQGKPYKDRDWRSYGFRIESGGRSLVYSGDVGIFEEMTPLFREPCDLALVDASHGPLEAICDYFRQGNFRVGRLGLFHLGSEILSAPEAAVALVQDRLGVDVLIPAEGQTIEV